MKTLAINAGDPAVRAALRPALARLSPGAPIVIMIHGFRYCPSGQATDPHCHILSDAPAVQHWKAVSWPGQLQISDHGGLAIGFGWPGAGSIWAAHRRAKQAGQELADLIAEIASMAPGHPVHLIAHSLGARVALHAISQSPAHRVRRAILITPAVFAREATALATTDGLRHAEVFSVLGHENTLFDWLLRLALPLEGPTLGRGGPDLPHWLDLHLGRTPVLEALKGLGHAIDAPRARICHWSGYVRDGVWELYRAILHRPAETPLPLLRDLMTTGAEPANRAPAPPFIGQPETSL